jgi:hypothetical protein
MARGGLKLWIVAAIMAAAFVAHGVAAAHKHRLPVLRVVPKPARGTASATIGPQGGALRVRTPSRAVVKLVIPPGALAQETRLTMTPLARVKRIPFKRGFAGAVQLGPEGTVLAKPAKLLFHPRKPVARKLQTPFSAAGNGSSFHIYPGKAGRTMTVPIVHFSVYGEGEASKQEVRGEAGRQQGSALALVERDLAAGGSDKELGNAFVSLAKRVAPEVSAALTDDAMVSRALDDALSLAEELRLAGWSSGVLPPEFGDKVPASVAPRLGPLLQQIAASFPTQIVDNALARALDRCEAEHSQKSRDDVLSIMELQRFFGASDEIDLSLLDRCYGYELRYTFSSAGSAAYHYDHSSQYVVDYGDYSENRNATVSASVPLARSASGAYSGSAPLSWKSSSWTTDNDNTGTNQAGGTCEIDFKESLTGPSPGTLTVSSLTLGAQPSAKVAIANLNESWHIDETAKAGPCPVFDQDLNGTYLMGSISRAHYDHGDKVEWEPEGAFGLDLPSGWAVGSGEVLATRTLSGSSYDLGPESNKDIPYTETFQIVRVSG